MFVSLFAYLLLGIGVFGITATPSESSIGVSEASSLTQLTPRLINTVKLISETHQKLLAQEKTVRKQLTVQNTATRSKVAGASGNKSLAYAPAKEGSHVFYAGQCTRYIASKMVIPWNGNAKTWLSKAESMGYETSESPRPGSVVVTAEGPYGHVAIVEEIKGDTMIISEMNYQGWGKLSSREVPLDYDKIKGFITDDRLNS